MVDIHSHILPETDDGADSWETAVAMCHRAARDGIDHMVATPHANDEFFYERARHAAALEELRRLVGPNPALSLGCDFHFSFENLRDALEHPERFVIGDTRYLLIELSDYAMPGYVSKNLARLIEAGFLPILTHPERNLMLQREPARVLEWTDQGCVVQLTASSLTGLWGKMAARICHWLLQHHVVHVLATDAHDLTARAPVLSAARDLVARQYGAAVAAALVEHNPRAVVEGLPLPYFPKPVLD